MSAAFVWSDTFNVPADFATIQEALDAAADGDTVCVSPGTYFENIDFLGKAITLVSTDGPGVTTVDGGGIGPVVTMTSGEANDSVLDGFTITNGLSANGGGIFCIAFPTIMNNTISGNMATNDGGGLSCLSYLGSPTICGNTFFGNSAVDGGGMRINTYSSAPLNISDNTFMNNTATDDSGAMQLYIGPGPTTIVGNTVSGNMANGDGGGAKIYPDYFGVDLHVADNTFSGNMAGDDSGAMHLYSPYSGASGTMLITGNTISGNSAGGTGGAILSYLYAGDLEVANNLFVNNSSVSSGGACDVGILDGGASLSFSNNTFSGNTSTGAGTALNVFSYYAPATLDNSIVWGNVGGPPVVGDIVASYSDVEGGLPGTGNLDADPQFVSGPLGDFYLSQVAAGQASDSPAVNAGDPVAPLLPGTTRTDQVADMGVLDMGFHFPAVALPPGTAFLRGDFDGDGFFSGLVDGLASLSFQFAGGPPALCLEASDADGDGAYNGLVDALYTLGHQFQGGPPPPPPYPGCGMDPDPGGSLGCAQNGCP